MSLATTVGAGALLGSILAVGVYSALAPSDQSLASAPVVPTYAPVPTPTITRLADGCDAPAVLEGGECVVHQPGPTVTLAPAPVAAPAAQVGSSPVRAATTSEESGHEESEHEDGEHEDAEHEDHEDGGEHDD